MRNRTLRIWIVLTALVAVAGPMTADQKQQRRVESSRWVYEAVFNHPAKVLPATLYRETRCLAIFPGVKEAAFGIGGSHGTGTVSAIGKASGARRRSSRSRKAVSGSRSGTKASTSSSSSSPTGRPTRC